MKETLKCKRTYDNNSLCTIRANFTLPTNMYVCMYECIKKGSLFVTLRYVKRRPYALLHCWYHWKALDKNMLIVVFC